MIRIELQGETVEEVARKMIEILAGFKIVSFAERGGQNETPTQKDQAAD